MFYFSKALSKPSASSVSSDASVSRREDLNTASVPPPCIAIKQFPLSAASAPLHMASNLNSDASSRLILASYPQSALSAI